MESQGKYNVKYVTRSLAPLPLTIWSNENHAWITL